MTGKDVAETVKKQKRKEGRKVEMKHMIGRRKEGREVKDEGYDMREEIKGKKACCITKNDR